MRILLDIVRQSLSTLWAHKLRSFLTMFGIAWGVGSLLLLVGLGEGFRSGQEKQLATLGQNIMFMFPGRIPAFEGSTQSGQTYYFTYADFSAIRQQAKFVGAVSPVLNREDIRAVSDYGSTNGQIFGVASDYNQIRNVPISPGRWFNDQDNGEHRRVAVVGWEMLKNMFPGRPAVGSTILLNGISFDVIGVVAKVGRDGNNGTNSRIFIPIETMRNLFRLTKANSEDAISFINYAPIRKGLHTEAKNEIHQIIASRHGFDPKLEDAFEDWDTIENMKTRGQDLRRHGLVPRRGRSRDPRTRCHRHHQHHAGFGERAHQGNWLAQSAGCNPQKYSYAILCRRSFSDRIQWRHRFGSGHRLCNVARHVAGARGV